MICMHCGKELRDGSKFCSFCGQKQISPEDIARAEAEAKAKAAAEAAAKAEDTIAKLEAEAKEKTDAAAKATAAGDKETAAILRREAAAAAQAAAQAREEEEARLARERSAARRAARQKAKADGAAVDTEAAARAKAEAAAKAEAEAKAKAEAEAAAKAKAEAEAKARAEAEAAARAKADADARANRQKRTEGPSDTQAADTADPSGTWLPDTTDDTSSDQLPATTDTNRNTTAPIGDTAFCQRCGKANPVGQDHCRFCGYDMTAPNPNYALEDQAQDGKKKLPKIKIRDFGDVKIFLLAAIYVLALVIGVTTCLGKAASKAIKSVTKKHKTKVEKVDESYKEPEEDEIDEYYAEEEQEYEEKEEAYEEPEETYEEPEQMSEEEERMQKYYEYVDSIEIGGVVNYNDVLYKPSDEDNVQPFNMTRYNEIYYGQGWDDDSSTSGYVYDATTDKDLYVEAYYEQSSMKPERVITCQPDDAGTKVYDAYFYNGQLLAIQEYTTGSYNPYNDSANGKKYILLYANDRLQQLTIMREDGRVDTYDAQDLETMGDASDLFIAREADYLNRAYQNYDLVTR